jgi:hypothetical protein
MRVFACLLLFCCINGMVCISTDSAAAVAVDDIDRLRTNILALDRVQKNIHKEIDARTVAATISSTERNELLIFTSYLQDRNREYCTQLEKLAGHAAVADLPCPEKQVELPVTPAKTTAEEMTDLDQLLAESLGAFDEMLLKEQERVASRQPRQRESGGSGAAGSVGAGGEGRDEKSGNMGAQNSGQRGAGRQHQGQSATSTSTGNARQTGNVNRSGKNTLNTDDDIVARQLREAAEKETDPELKERLWAEYRKYKTGG